MLLLKPLHPLTSLLFLLNLPNGSKLMNVLNTSFCLLHIKFSQPLNSTYLSKKTLSLFNLPSILAPQLYLVSTNNQLQIKNYKPLISLCFTLSLEQTFSPLSSVSFSKSVTSTLTLLSRCHLIFSPSPILLFITPSLLFSKLTSFTNHFRLTLFLYASDSFHNTIQYNTIQ